MNRGGAASSAGNQTLGAAAGGATTVDGVRVDAAGAYFRGAETPSWTGIKDGVMVLDPALGGAAPGGQMEASLYGDGGVVCQLWDSLDGGDEGAAAAGAASRQRARRQRWEAAGRRGTSN
jgi:hypothetical protein